MSRQTGRDERRPRVAEIRAIATAVWQPSQLENGPGAAHSRRMDDPKIRLFTDGKSAGVPVWTWEMLLEGKGSP